MNQINVVTIGKLIAAHRESDEEKFRTYVEFIAKAYEQQGNDRAAHIIRSNYTGDYGEQWKLMPDYHDEHCAFDSKPIKRTQWVRFLGRTNHRGKKIPLPTCTRKVALWFPW